MLILTAGISGWIHLILAFPAGKIEGKTDGASASRMACFSTWNRGVAFASHDSKTSSLTALIAFHCCQRSLGCIQASSVALNEDFVLLGQKETEDNNCSVNQQSRLSRFLFFFSPSASDKTKRQLSPNHVVFNQTFPATRQAPPSRLGSWLPMWGFTQETKLPFSSWCAWFHPSQRDELSWEEGEKSCTT